VAVVFVLTKEAAHLRGRLNLEQVHMRVARGKDQRLDSRNGS